MSSFQRLDSWNQDSNDAKKQKIHHPTVRTDSQKKQIYQPIASLTRTQCCPLIRGTITSISNWRMTNRGTRYSNFVLEDGSGEIDGVIFRTSDWEFEKKFVVGARLTVADAVVKPVNPSYRRNSNHLYELSISNDCQTIKFEDSAIDDNKLVLRSFDPKSSLKDLMQDIQPGDLVNIVGLVVSCEQETFQKSFHGYIECRKKLILKDVEDCQIEVIVFGRASSRYEFPMDSVVVVKNAILNVEGMKTTLTVEWTDFHLAPPSPEMQEIERILKPSSVAPVTSVKPPSIPSIPSVEPATVAPIKPPAEIATPACVTKNKQVKKILTANRELDLVIPSTSGTSVENHFVKIDVIHDQLAPGSVIDVIGVVSCRLSPQHIKCSNGMKTKMSIELADETGQTIWMVVWGPHVDKINDRQNMIIAAKKVQVRCWNDTKELNCTDLMSSLIVEPEIDEVKILQKWLARNVSNIDREQNVEATQRSVRIADFQNGEKISFLGIVTKVMEVKILKAEFICDFARTIEVIDSSGKTIHLTLWGELARIFEVPIESVIYVTDVKISRSEKIKGAMTWTSRFEVDPPACKEESERLQRWFFNYKNIASSNRYDEESLNIFRSLEI